MTKKNFEKIAKAFAESRPSENSDKLVQWWELRNAFCKVFKDDNPAFDVLKFLAATGK